jgi:flagellar hook-associated protein 1
MSGIIGAMNTALSGIEAFESGINTVSNNLANETVNGFAAESVNLSTEVDLANGSGFGVQAPMVTRAADGFAAGVLRTANAANEAATTLATNLGNISSAVLNNGNIHTSMNQFFQDVSTLAANPSSAGARETVLSDAQTVSGTFQSAANSLGTTMGDAVTALQENVSTANNLLGQLATINQGLANSPNNPSLLDQQEAALSSLSNLLPVTVLTQANGTVQLSAGNNVLLNQVGAQTLTVTGGTATQPPQVNVGSQPLPLELTDTEGQMGANIATYQAGAQALQGLNAIAAVFTNEVNTAQAEGLTTNGTQGTNLFAAPPASTVTAAANAVTGAANSGSATLTAAIVNPAQLPTDGGPFTLTFSTAATGSFTAVDQATNTQVPVTTTPPPPTTLLAFAGMNVTVTGAAANGDSFIVNPAPGAASGMSVVATSPDDVAAADPFVSTPGIISAATGAVTDNNAGTITTGTDSVTTTTPASFVPSTDFSNSPFTVVFTSTTGSSTPDGFSVFVGTPSTPPAAPSVPVATGTLTSSNGTLSGTISVQYPNIAPATFWQLPISGKPATGDALTLSPGGSTSGSNAARMATIFTTPNTANNGSSLQSSVIGFTTGLGSNANEAQTLSTGTTAQVASATTNLQTVAGVNSDQQAVLLVNYQQAFQAASQVISTAHSMFESLVQSV